jgi:hypothetical protein
MKKEGLKPIWMAVLLGILVATAPNWLFSDQQKKAAYDAPWIYPGNMPSQQ